MESLHALREAVLRRSLSRAIGVVVAHGLCLTLFCGLASAALAQSITSANFAAPTARYPHAVLGDDIEYGALEVVLSNGLRRVVVLDEAQVFEDVAPRLLDLDDDRRPEVIVVESHQTEGARLAIWELAGSELRRAAVTPYIGQRFRWLAPVGAADLDGDGLVEIAYVDRPHLARVLRIWTFERHENGATLTEVATLGGVTNHRIGDRDIAGGIRRCGGAAEMIVADENWRDVLALRFDGRRVSQRTLGTYRGRTSVARAMRCGTLR